MRQRALLKHSRGALRMRRDDLLGQNEVKVTVTPGASRTSLYFIRNRNLFDDRSVRFALFNLRPVLHIDITSTIDVDNIQPQLRIEVDRVDRLSFIEEL